MAAFYVYRPVCSIMKCRATEKNCRQGGLEGGVIARCAKRRLSAGWATGMDVPRSHRSDPERGRLTRNFIHYKRADERMTSDRARSTRARTGVYADGAAGLTSLRFFRVGIPRTSRKRGTGLSGSVSGRRSIHLPSGGALRLERGMSSPVSALSNIGVVAFFQRRKFHNRRHLPESAMFLPPEL